MSVTVTHIQIYDIMMAIHITIASHRLHGSQHDRLKKNK